MLEAIKRWFADATSAPLRVPGLRFHVLGVTRVEDFHVGVEIENDALTPLPFVIDCLQQHLSMPQGQAQVAAALCHQHGGVVIACASVQAAQQAADALANAATRAGHPLQARVVSAQPLR